jgi:hypothetical protein
MVIEFCSLLSACGCIEFDRFPDPDPSFASHAFRGYCDMAQWYAEACPSMTDGAEVSPSLFLCLN